MIWKILVFIFLGVGVSFFLVYLRDTWAHPMCPICGDNKDTERRDGIGYCRVHGFVFKKRKRAKEKARV